MMKVIIGLGNPGDKYKGSRHNVGFEAVDKIAEEMELVFAMEKKFKAMVARGEEILLVKPETFMNRSGESVAKICGFYKVKGGQLWLIHDDLDIRLGDFKVSWGKGPKIHNGVNDVEEKLGMDSFWRIRIGVDNREGREISGEKYVLGKFSSQEKEIVDQVIERVSKLE